MSKGEDVVRRVRVVVCRVCRAYDEGACQARNPERNQTDDVQTLIKPSMSRVPVRHNICTSREELRQVEFFDHGRDSITRNTKNPAATSLRSFSKLKLRNIVDHTCCESSMSLHEKEKSFVV
jgi:hypothetical protein